MNHQEPLLDLLFDRLADDDVPAETADVVLAALGGDDDLAGVLGGEPPRLDPHTATDETPRPRIYLSSVTVAGFRGVGPERTLAIRPGPGLTLVVGRNGSGKSSFAEAVELALTGDSARWADKNSVWKTGWRNLHAPDPCRIEVELRVDGESTPTRVRRSWRPDAELTDAEVVVTDGRGRHGSLAELGLDRPLELYRPFLTAAELGRLSAGRQSQLFDAIYAILGLEALTEADRRLMVAVRRYEGAVKGVRTQRDSLRARLAEVDDERARRADALLGKRQPDLDALAGILAEPLPDGDDETVRAHRRLAALTVPEADEVTRLAGQLRDAAAEARQLDGGYTRAAVRSAELLRLAIEHHADTGDGPCPVCAIGTIDGGWRKMAEAYLVELRERTVAAQRAEGRLSELTRRARTLIDDIEPPRGVPGISVESLHAAVAALRAAPGAPAELADHLVAHYPAVAAAARQVRERAAAWLRERDGGWQRVAAELRVWIEAARELPAQQATLATLKAARSWLQQAGARIRDERVAPFAAHSQRIWRELRQESNVELGAMTLAGNNTRRRVVFPVSVDGADNGTALGVMSQGEMHALGLATFLPRGCAQESPFRFIVIDDPVQSMDPSKVDGLARVLAELAEQRQVIVFTHDTRLPDAVRRLDLGRGQEIEVTRAERSVVTLRPGSDPVHRYLDDAKALALSEELPGEVRAPVVAELCRSALEAACHPVIWRNRLARGETHADVEALLEKASRRLTLTFALALFDDIDRGGDVLGHLKRRYGEWAVRTYQACREGVHGQQLADLPGLVMDVRALIEALP